MVTGMASSAAMTDEALLEAVVPRVFSLDYLYQQCHPVFSSEASGDSSPQTSLL